MSSPAALSIAGHDLATLREWIQASSVPAALSQRARILLLADGVSNTDIAVRAGVSRPTVVGWRPRYADATHRHAKVQAWPARHPRVQLHCTPTDAWWPNPVKAFVAIVTCQALRRGDLSSVSELVAAIGRLVDGWNQRWAPVRWAKDAGQILARRKRHPSSETHRHRHGIGPPG